MAQINFKKILLENDISELVDIINYNFEQLILNGGGPKGEQGIIGPPGLPGIMGPQGDVGHPGIDGTYIFVSNLLPTDYQFGSNNESLPRNNDLYFETKDDEISVWKYDSTNWNFVKTIKSPSFSKILEDSNILIYPDDKKYKYISNDISKAYNVFISNDEFYNIENDLIDTNTYIFKDKFTSLNNFSNILTIASNKNQFRIFNSSSEFLTGSDVDFVQNKGGIVHSYEFDNLNDQQWYKIINGDISGNKNLLISLNNNNNNDLLLANTRNQLLVGGNENEVSSLASRLTVNNSLIIGNSDFYQYITGINEGVISQGNLSVGDSYSNNIYKGSFVDYKGKGSRLLVNTKSSILTSAVSSISLGIDNNSAALELPNNSSRFNFVLNGCKNAVDKNNLIIYEEINKNNILTRIDYITLKRGRSLDNSEGSVGIGNRNPKGLLEIGNSDIGKVSIGSIKDNISNPYMTNYIGFNSIKITGMTASWYRYGNSNISNGMTGNSAKTIWSGLQNDISISLIPSTGTIDIGYTNDDVYNNTKITLTTNDIYSNNKEYPLLILSSENSHEYLSITGIDKMPGLIVGNSPLGNLNDVVYDDGRIIEAIFGNSIKSNRTGSPAIYSTNGLNNTNIIRPHFTMYGELNTSGLYFSEGLTANITNIPNSYKSLGLSVYKESAIHIGKDDNEKIRIGLIDNNPIDTISINNMLIYHEDDQNNNSFIGYNVYKNNADGLLYPIQTGSLTGEYGKGSIQLKFGLYDKIINHEDSNIGVYPDGGELTLSTSYSSNSFDEQRLYEDTSSSSKIRLITNGRPYYNSAGINVYKNNNIVPKMLIGFKDDGLYESADNNFKFLRRGTLSLLSQYLTCKQGQDTSVYIIDDYAIALYDYKANPVLGISPITNKVLNSNVKQISFRLLSDKKCNFGNTFGSTGNDYAFLTYKNEYNQTTNKWNSDGKLTINSQTKINSVAVGKEPLHYFNKILPLNITFVKDSITGTLHISESSIGYKYLRSPYFEIINGYANIKTIKLYLENLDPLPNMSNVQLIATLQNYEPIDTMIITLVNSEIGLLTNNNQNYIEINFYALNRTSIDISKIQSMTLSILLLEVEESNGMENIVNPINIQNNQNIS